MRSSQSEDLSGSCDQTESEGEKEKTPEPEQTAKENFRLPSGLFDLLLLDQENVLNKGLVATVNHQLSVEYIFDPGISHAQAFAFRTDTFLELREKTFLKLFIEFRNSRNARDCGTLGGAF